MRFISSIAVLINDLDVQFGAHLQILQTKLKIISLPLGVCETSGETVLHITFFWICHCSYCT